MTCTCIPVGVLESNSYILNDGGALALVDCGSFSKSLRDAIAQQGGGLRYILLTHGHFDHIQGAAAAKAAYPDARVCISTQDAAYLTGEMEALPGHVMRSFKPMQPDQLLQDGDEIQLGESTLQAIATPGHTRGGMSFLLQPEGLLFTGDTLFFEEVGRDDFPGGDWEALQNAILRLYALPMDCKVLPGHGPASTLAHERVHNPYVKGESA